MTAITTTANAQPHQPVRNQGQSIIQRSGQKKKHIPAPALVLVCGDISKLWTYLDVGRTEHKWYDSELSELLTGKTFLLSNGAPRTTARLIVLSKQARCGPRKHGVDRSALAGGSE